jgi:hypothetical protein
MRPRAPARAGRGPGVGRDGAAPCPAADSRRPRAAACSAWAAAHRSGDFPSAEAAFRQILDRPDFSETEQQSALLGLARATARPGTRPRRPPSTRSSSRSSPTDERLPDALLELGRTYRSMGANKLALNRFYSVINSTLKLPQKGFEHYQSLARTAEYEIAETYYRERRLRPVGPIFRPAPAARPFRLRPRAGELHGGPLQMLAGDLENGVQGPSPSWRPGRQTRTYPRPATCWPRPCAG